MHRCIITGRLKRHNNGKSFMKGGYLNGCYRVLNVGSLLLTSL
jgi:hypothetical protein